MVKQHFIDPTYGGWYENWSDGVHAPSKDWKGSTWKCGYHEAMVYSELLRLGAMPGDTNWDYQVNGDDFVTLAVNYTGTGVVGKTRLQGDFDGDYDVRRRRLRHPGRELHRHAAQRPRAGQPGCWAWADCWACGAVSDCHIST